MYKSTSNNTKVFWYYERRRGWVKRWKVTMVADDERGLRAEDVHLAMRHCRFLRIVLVELALDFAPSVVNHDFVRRHAIFGKSRRR
jgi:hypothetical protein